VSSAPHTTDVTRLPRGERTRQRILDAAGQCFAARGYARTTVEEVASRAGVSKALVYHHFGSKERILDAVLERTIAEWDAVTDLAARSPRGSALESIASMHRATLAYARDHPALQALIELDSKVLLDAPAGRAARESMQRHRAALVETLRAGVDSGEVRGDLEIEAAADVILVHHLGIVQAVFEPEWVEPSEKLVETGIDILLRGLASGKGA
jgi:AcrR family transcriptional regulator